MVTMVNEGRSAHYTLLEVFAKLFFEGEANVVLLPAQAHFVMYLFERGFISKVHDFQTETVV